MAYGHEAMNQPAIAWTFLSKGAPDFVTDLPGHIGLNPAQGTERNSDWGFGSKSHMILLTPYWQRRFAKYCRDTNKSCSFATPSTEEFLEMGKNHTRRTA